MFSKSFCDLEKFKQIKRRTNMVDFIYTLSGNITKNVQEKTFIKILENQGRPCSNFSVQLLKAKDNNNRQNHYYETIKRFRNIFNSQDFDECDLKSKEIIHKHLEKIFPKNVVKNIYSHRWANPAERRRSEEMLRDSQLFESKGDISLIRFMELVAKKEKNLTNMRHFFIGRIYKLKSLNNSNIFALANMTDQLYKDLKSKYVCLTCYCKDGEENEKFNDHYYCNCECHLNIREQERSLKDSQSLRESQSHIMGDSLRESATLRDSLDIFSSYNELSKSKVNYSESVEDEISIEVKLNLKKKDKSLNSSSLREPFRPNLSSRANKSKNKIDNLFRRVSEKTGFKNQKDQDNKKGIAELDDSMKLSVLDENKSVQESKGRIRIDKSIYKIQEENPKEIKKDEKKIIRSQIDDESRKKKMEGIIRRQETEEGKKVAIRSDSRANPVPIFTSNKNKIPSLFEKTKIAVNSLRLSKPKSESKMIIRDENVEDVDKTKKFT